MTRHSPSRYYRLGSTWRRSQHREDATMSTTAFPVLLTFDLDAESGALARDPETAERPVALSVGHYGPNVAVPRLLALLRKQAIPATFFVPGWVVEHYPSTIEAILRDGHELAHHG